MNSSKWTVWSRKIPTSEDYLMTDHGYWCSCREIIAWWAADYYGLGIDLTGRELRHATMLEF